MPKRSTKKLPRQPVPEWMDKDLKPTAAKLDVCGRHELAAKLERQAEQLRGLNPPPPKRQTIVVAVTKTMANSLLEYYRRWIGDRREDGKWEDETKMEIGARWFLEGALPLISDVEKTTIRLTRYRNAEGLEHGRLFDDAIRAAFERWRDETEAEAD